MARRRAKRRAARRRTYEAMRRRWYFAPVPVYSMAELKLCDPRKDFIQIPKKNKLPNWQALANEMVWTAMDRRFVFGGRDSWSPSVPRPPPPQLPRSQHGWWRLGKKGWKRRSQHGVKGGWRRPSAARRRKRQRRNQKRAAKRKVAAAGAQLEEDVYPYPGMRGIAVVRKKGDLKFLDPSRHILSINKDARPVVASQIVLCSKEGKVQDLPRDYGLAYTFAEKGLEKALCQVDPGMVMGL